VEKATDELIRAHRTPRRVRRRLPFIERGWQPIR